nr:hypothetical protein [uncultured Bacteroides sp.]
MKINLSYSVKLLSEEKAQDALQYLSKHLIVDETKRKLVSIKFCELHVLNQLTYVISEICDCLIINANQAAITLTNHLFENMLKQALITIDSNGRCFDENEPMDKTFEAEVKEYDEKNLCDAIKQCESKRLITQDEVQRLNYLKNKFRNPFSHACYSKKLFKEAKMHILKGSLTDPQNIKEEFVNISNIPFLQLEAQKDFAEKNAFGYFVEIYSYVDKLDRKLLDLYPETKQFLQDNSLI